MDFRSRSVAPLAGAWIEISADIMTCTTARESLPSRERGLKFVLITLCYHLVVVAPLAGAWIEIENGEKFTAEEARRSPRGSVD